jgi:hypothetical protein
VIIVGDIEPITLFFKEKEIIKEFIRSLYYFIISISEDLPFRGDTIVRTNDERK